MPVGGNCSPDDAHFVPKVAPASPDMTMAEKTDRWQFLATSSVAPGPAQAMIPAWMPEEQPLTRNQVRSAPNASAASCCACSMTPQGALRLSRPRGGEGTTVEGDR